MNKKMNKRVNFTVMLSILTVMILVSCGTTKSSVTGEGGIFRSAEIKEKQQEYDQAIVIYAMAVEKKEIEVERFNEEVDRIGAGLPEKDYKSALRKSIKIIEELQDRNAANKTYVTFYEAIKFILEMKL